MSQLQRKTEEVKPPKSQGERKGGAATGKGDTLGGKRQLQMPLKGAGATEERLGRAGYEGD